MRYLTVSNTHKNTVFEERHLAIVHVNDAPYDISNIEMFTEILVNVVVDFGAVAFPTPALGGVAEDQ